LSQFLATYISYFIYALNLAIFGRVIMTWISPGGNDPISVILYQITEPILAPIRSVMRQILPSTGMFDFTPMVALILLNFILLPVLRSAL